MTTPKIGTSFQPLAKPRSWKNMPLPPDGANSHETPVQAFAEVAGFVLQNMDSFDIWTFVNLLKGREELISFEQIRTYFARWTREQAGQGRIKVAPGIYDYDVWQIISNL